MASRVRLKQALDGVRESCDLPARRDADPVGIVHRYAHPLDRELVGLIAASMAFGNVKTIRNKLEELLARVGPSPHLAARDEAAVVAALRGFRHRVYRGEDLARLMAGAARLQSAHGSLGELFASLHRETGGDTRESLARFCDQLREASNLRRGGARRGPSHMLPDPRAGSAVKRLLLYVRWMVRPADGIDLGLWDVPSSALVIPVDTHIHKLARNLGLTKRDDVSWRTATEITAALAELDAGDPVKYDFSLCHMGMLRRCPSRRDPVRCEGCPVKPVCRHWPQKN
ncbi:MAG TPA: TIGR02757 family protein [Polyangiaceae bacterium]|nr:TIGR02757 family protein [Polyangiaceae bacterium]